MLKVSKLYQTTDRVGFHQKLSSLMQLVLFIFATSKCNLTLGEKVEIHPFSHTTTCFADCSKGDAEIIIGFPRWIPITSSWWIPLTGLVFSGSLHRFYHVFLPLNIRIFEDLHFSGWNLCWLVVEPYPSEKYEFVSWDYSSQYIGKTHVPVTTKQYGLKSSTKTTAWSISRCAESAGSNGPDDADQHGRNIEVSMRKSREHLGSQNSEYSSGSGCSSNIYQYRF